MSCSNKSFETKEELVEFIQDGSNGYIQNKKVNGINFTLVYKPTDLLVEQEVGKSSVTKKKIQELKVKYSKYLYFNLSMSSNNKELLSIAPKNRSEFGTMVNQLVFGMQDKVHLYTKKRDTVDMIDYIYPRMYGMSRNTSMLFVYPRDEEKLKEGYLNFTINDLGLFTGEVKFKINTKEINNEPKLIFDGYY